jgi:hypothetical protein
MSLIDKKQALNAALNGVEYLVKNQLTDKHDANRGRYLCQYDYINDKVLALTTNWTTGVCIECMLIAHKVTSNQKYLDSGQLAAEYLENLQVLPTFNKKMGGFIREETPQTMWAHPRDAVTAAWAMLDWSQYTGQKKYFERSVIFADWFLDVAMERGYPYWTIRLDEKLWEPWLFGSFQSGAAFYLFRLFNITGEQKYKAAGCQILDFYNKYHLAPNGKIQVAVDMMTLKPVLACEVASNDCPDGWELMHQYNDDFGALANLAAWKLTRNDKYFIAAKCFLGKMLSIQREDGGFGPADYSVSSAAGVILMELMAANILGISFASSEQLSNIVKYILGLQIHTGFASGGFRGVNNESYKLFHCSNARETSYSIMGLMRYAGATDVFYFLDSKVSDKALNCPPKKCSLIVKTT